MIPPVTIDTHAALLHFQRYDTHLAHLLASALAQPQPLAIPHPKPPEQYFASIVSSIISQQISTRAADAVKRRVIAALGELSVDTIHEVPFETLKACGLSQQKTRYLKHNAAVWPTIPYHMFPYMEDEAIITELTKLYGIGRWTAEMFLMFSLARPDVFSFGDLGLMNGLFEQYPVIRPHYRRKIQERVASWSPHRTTAALVLWYHKDNGPVLL